MKTNVVTYKYAYKKLIDNSISEQQYCWTLNRKLNNLLDNNYQEYKQKIKTFLLYVFFVPSIALKRKKNDFCSD